MGSQNCLPIGDKTKEESYGKRKGESNFANGLIVPSSGRSGGIALLWKRDISVEVQGYLDNDIDAIVADPSSGFKRRIIGFYGHLETHRGKESWNLLRTLNKRYKLPWMCFGDFNEIVSMEEKRGVMRPQK